ncbi:MAG: DUF4214 domain-containing protein [Acidobacteria bacterium]|nr:DUF4214 domain-containing protein [Acidobacteriota bacterium]
MPRLLRYLRSRFSLALQSDEAFIEQAYREILGRPADQDGINHYRALMRAGLGRVAVLLELARSDEFRKSLAPVTGSTLPDLRSLRPAQYREATDRTNGQQIPVFEVRTPDDFDWFEAAILEHGFYEQPGVWTLGVDIDKRVIAEMISAFAPRHALELGCAAGAVIECLDRLGIRADGVEISSMAVARSAEAIRPRIHHGDVLAVPLARTYDLVFGLDVFEHLNPNLIDRYLARLVEISTEDAFIFCNIPAFGTDPVFGSVFPLYLDEWEPAVAARRPFSVLHVDHRGYPIHGHLTWADWRWWTGRFETHGLRRDLEIERALHEKYDSYLSKRSPARKAFFVFAKPSAAGRGAAIVDRIRRTTGSGVLPEC